MKASLKLRDDERPLLRAKIPVSILGLPFLSGVSAGEARELRLDVATAFESGPSFRLSYRPNDSSNPFAVSVKTGAGALGSPASAAMTMSAEFNLVGRGGPRFTIQIKPSFGDFCVRKSTSAAAGPPPPPPPYVPGGPVVVDHGADGEGPVAGSFAGKKPNGISAGSPVAAPSGIGGLLSGAEITATSSLPLGSRAAVRLRWGVRIPPEFRSGFMEDRGGVDPIGGVSLRKLPLLVMSKISIEHLPGEEAPIAKKPPGTLDACLSAQRQLVALQADQGMLRKAIEELRAGLAASVGDATGNGSLSEGTGREGWEGDRHGAKANPFVKSGSRSVGRRSDGKGSEGGATASKEDVSEELRRALMGAGGSAAGT